MGAEIPLFEPLALAKLVQKRPPDKSYFLTDKFGPFVSHPDSDTVHWDVLKGDWRMGTPSIPGNKATFVGHQGRGKQSSSGVYMNMAKMFKPTLTRMLRDPGQLGTTNATAYVAREVKHLADMVDRFVEYCLWGVLTGNLVLNYPQYGVNTNIDYLYPATHKPVVSTSWATATPIQIVGMVESWIQLIALDSDSTASTVLCSRKTIRRIFDSFAAEPLLLTDGMKENYWNSGGTQLGGFLGLNWVICNQRYDTANVAGQYFFNEDSLILCNLDENNPVTVYETPIYDEEAPDHWTGKFTKSWLEHNASSRQYSIQYGFVPAVERPEQFVYVQTVAP